MQAAWWILYRKSASRGLTPESSFDARARVIAGRVNAHWTLPKRSRYQMLLHPFPTLICFKQIRIYGSVASSPRAAADRLRGVVRAP